MKTIDTQTCIVGGGPAGAMLAMLLAQAGIDVTLLEKATTYERKFRGESISPDSVALLTQLNIMPHLQAHGFLHTEKMQVCEKDHCLLEVDFNRFRYPHKFSIDIPQPVLIDALINEAKKYPNFHHLMATKYDNLMIEEDRIVGVYAKQKKDMINIQANVVVGADGRYGKVRKHANLDATINPVSRDVLWFMLPMPKNWGDVAKLSFWKDQHIISLPTYPDKLRVGFNIPSGEYSKVKHRPISYLHEAVSLLDPSLANSVREHIKTWSDTSLLDIFTMELPAWSRDGLILIGDASHTLTPILGQGVNHALKDAHRLSQLLIPAFAHNQVAFETEFFQEFINERRADKNIVHNFQIRQEKMLSMTSSIQTWLRRFFYNVMHRSKALQNILWGKILYGYQKKLKQIA